jgi:hypothetical protein
MDEIFLIELRTRWQCIESDQIRAAEENYQNNFLGYYRGFSLGITSSRLADNIWSDRHQKRNQNSLLVTTREKE